jgi:hypothetical protein
METHRHRSRVTHRLNRLVHLLVLAFPIPGPHTEQVKKDRIGIISNGLDPELLSSSAGVSPYLVIVMTLFKDVVPPTSQVKTFLAWKDTTMPHPRHDLQITLVVGLNNRDEGNQTSKFEG